MVRKDSRRVFNKGNAMFVVTGGGSGIGQALAHALSLRDQKVLIIGRRERALQETARFSTNIEYLCADVSTLQGRDHIANRILKVPHLSGLVHNAGIIEPILPIQDLSENAWRKVMSTNLDAPFFLNKLLATHLVGGRVLHMGSGAAYFPVTGWSAYCVSKAGLSMLTRCCQLEYDTVSFASVMPGIIDTPMQKEIRSSSRMDEDKSDFFKRLHEEKRLLSPETVAAFLTWLLLDTEASQYISKEWDIYDTSHHLDWLVPPFSVPTFE